MFAVITGDIVNSTLIKAEEEQELIQMIQALLSPHPSDFFRGDSFQAFVEDPREAIRKAMLCRTAAKSLVAEDAPVQADVRLSIGYGDVTLPVVKLATAKGEAFLLSGRALDEMPKAGGKIIISCRDKLPAIAFTVIADYINSLFSQLTQKQAEVIHQLLLGLNQQQVADKLNKSKSTISQHVTAGKWDEIENIIRNHDQLMQLIS